MFICQLENEKLLHKQSVRELEAQIKSHEGSMKGMEVMLREKEESLLESSKALTTQKQRTHKLADKVLTKTLIQVLDQLFLHTCMHEKD